MVQKKIAQEFWLQKRLCFVAEVEPFSYLLQYLNQYTQPVRGREPHTGNREQQEYEISARTKVANER